MIRLSDDVKKYLRLRSIITFVIVLIFYLIIASFAIYFDCYKEWVMMGLGFLLLIQLVVFVFVRPVFYQKVTKYQIFNTRLVTVQGFIIVEHKMLPLKRVQGVEVSHGIISRRYNLAKLTVTTAGTSFNLPPLKIDEAYQLQSQMIELVKEEFTNV